MGKRMIPTYIKRRISVKISDVETAHQQNRPYQYERELIDYVTNIQFSTMMPGGFGGCTISLVYAPETDWTIMRPGNHVRIWDGGNILYEGRVEDPGTITARAGSSFDVICVGHIARLLDDKIFRACFVDSAFSSWEQKIVSKDIVRMNHENPNHVNSVRTNTHSERFVSFLDDDDTDNDTSPNRMVLHTLTDWEYHPYSCIRMVYRLLGGFAGRNDITDPAQVTEKIQKIVMSYQLELDTGGHWRAEIISRGSWKSSSDYVDNVFVRQDGYQKVGCINPGVYTAEESKYTNLPITLTPPARCLNMRLVHARGNIEDNDRYSYNEIYRFRVNEMKVIGVVNYPVTIRSVFEYVAADLFNNFIADDYYDEQWHDISLALDQFVENGPVDRASVLERANMADTWDYACWDWGNFYYTNPDKAQNRTGMNLYKSSYSDPYTNWSVALNYTDYVNEVLVRYYLRNGDETELIFPADDDGYQNPTVVRPLSGVTRRASIEVPQDGYIGKDFAKKIARRYLLEHSQPIVTGTVEVSGPLRTESGALVEPWRIRAGQYISNADIPAEFGGKMKILQVDVNLATGTAILTLGRKASSRVDELFSRMSMQHRHRWRKNSL
jgi:hypothetical protein